jgi:uncharacterized OB-fold protein
MQRSIYREIPVKKGLWLKKEDGTPRLLTSKCQNCGEITFPSTTICPNCQSKELVILEVGPKAKVYSVTVVLQQPPAWYKGIVPYALGYVELPEGIRVETLFTGCEPDDLEIGMDVTLVIEELFVDEEGNRIIAYKFKPITDPDR